MSTPIPIIGSIAVLAWLSLVGHAVLLLCHPAPGVSATGLLFAGYKFYIRSNFDPSVWPAHTRFLISAGLFFACVIAMVVVATVLAPDPGEQR